MIMIVLSQLDYDPERDGYPSRHSAKARVETIANFRLSIVAKEMFVKEFCQEFLSVFSSSFSQLEETAMPMAAVRPKITAEIGRVTKRLYLHGLWKGPAKEVFQERSSTGRDHGAPEISYFS